MPAHDCFVARLLLQIQESDGISLDLLHLPIPIDSEMSAALDVIADKMPGLRHLCLKFTLPGDEKDYLKDFCEHALHLNLAHGETLLAQVHSLNFGDTQVTDASILPLARLALDGDLSHLQWLYLGATKVTDDSIVPLARAAADGHLPLLAILDLRGTHITNKSILPLAQAAKNCRVPRLKELYFAVTAVDDESIVPLAQAAADGQLRELDTLDLGATQVTDATVLLLAHAAGAGNLPRFNWISLWNTQATGHRAILDSCNPVAILQWYRDREDNSALPNVLPEAKLMVVGQPNVGKSFLCHRIFLSTSTTQQFSFPQRQATHDFDMHEVHLPHSLYVPEELNGLKLRLWDFGGQEELHSAHRFFIGAERAFYILVLNATQDSTANRVTYWLRFLAQHGTVQKGTHRIGAPVVLVMSQCDRIRLARDMRLPKAEEILANHEDLQKALNEAAAPEHNYFGANVLARVDGYGYPDQETCDSLPPELLEELRGVHAGACRAVQTAVTIHLKQVIGLNQAMAPSDLAIRNWVLDRFHPHERDREVGYFCYDDGPFKEWCRAQQLDRDARGQDVFDVRVGTALRVLKSLGLIHWIGDHLKDQDVRFNPVRFRVFNPRWVKTPVYRVIRAAQVDHWCGWITNETLDRLLPCHDAALSGDEPVMAKDTLFDRLRFTATDRDWVMQLMKTAELIFPVSRAGEHKGWLIPDKLFSWDGTDDKRAQRSTSLRFTTSFLPGRVLLRFLAKHIVKTVEEDGRGEAVVLNGFNKTIWRNRARLRWRLAGHIEDFIVDIRTEESPPIAVAPSVSIAVEEGAADLHAHVIQHIVHEMNGILEGEGLNQMSVWAECALRHSDDEGGGGIGALVDGRQGYVGSRLRVFYGDFRVSNG
jgi:GTPase SAR1 family protein